MKQARVWIMLVFGGLASLAFFAGNSDAKPETVRVILLEVPRASWGIAGKPASTRK